MAEKLEIRKNQSENFKILFNTAVSLRIGSSWCQYFFGYGSQRAIFKPNFKSMLSDIKRIV